MNYKEPKFNENSFTCPYCQTYAQQKWRTYKIFNDEHSSYFDFVSEQRLYAKGFEDEEVESIDVYPISHKSACAILRLAVQHLCKELGEKGKNINDDIGSLVSKGLPEKIQKALDIVRVVGNNAVYPGKMEDSDTKIYAEKMFMLVNMIVEDRIVKPKEIDDLFEGLPEENIKAIERRDNK